MAAIVQYEDGSVHFLLGNQAIAKGTLEVGANHATGYPWTPSSEIVRSLARVAMEGTARGMVHQRTGKLLLGGVK
jgi:TPP-dependent indolepyruvate ferredoxin oxidoreductase alpha subunit